VKPGKPLRRTELKSGSKPLQRTSGLRRSDLDRVMRAAPLPSKSKNRAVVERAWRSARDAHLMEVGNQCEIGPLLAEARIPAYRQCVGRATTCHHALARGMGGSRDNSVLLATCDPCHHWAESHPAEAEAIGAKVRHSN
jgi:hypothetical protein